jgi:amino acid transporter/mannitol/fructose-specific phosphotransferase system IIA component (Ntr-type)
LKKNNNSNKLNKKLGTLEVFTITSGAMISSGLFVLPGIAYAEAGPVVIIAYLIAGIFILPTLLAKVELATAMPKAGGSYFFIERSMGSIAGTIGGMTSWFSLSLKSAFALVGIGAFAHFIYPSFTELEIKLIVIGFCVIFTIMNLISVGLTAKVQNILVIILIVLIIAYIVAGTPFIEANKYSPFIFEGNDFRSVFGVVGLVFISFGGITKIASVAEEVKKPVKNIPRGAISAFIIVMILYVMAVFVTVGLLDSDVLIGSLTPLSDGGEIILGSIGLIVMAVAAILAFISTANAGILGASRFLMAMSRDRLLPQFFSNIIKKFRTPHFSILFTSGFMIIMILTFELSVLVKIASTMSILLFILIIFSSIIMRESKILNYKPTFKAPFYPYIQIAAIIFYFFLLYEMGIPYLVATLGFIGLAVLWNRAYAGRNKRPNSAMIHVIKRLIPEEIRGATLSDELREILIERDEITEDRFDKLVKNCEIIDLEESMKYLEFFKIVSERFSKEFDIDYNIIYNTFIKREEESTTSFRPGLAIPHITIEGEHKFELMMVRCEPGIQFSSDLPPVYAIFILIGTKDERHFHLKALSAIAQLTQSADFDKNWLRAKNTDELRDLILLAERERLSHVDN